MTDGSQTKEGFLKLLTALGTFLLFSLMSGLRQSLFNLVKVQYFNHLLVQKND